MRLRHILATRFNVASPGKEAEIRLKPGWLDSRFELFEKYCLPSVAIQTVKDFEWVIFFDEATPRAYLERLDTLRTIFPFRPWLTPLSSMRELGPKIAAHDGKSDWILSSRLDNDDVLAIDYIERVQAIARSGQRAVINFDDGVILSLKGTKGALFKAHDDCNPFASLIEPAGDQIKTIWGETHRNISKLGPVKNVKGPPAWMQIVHGGNVSNEVNGRRIPAETYSSLFPHMELKKFALTEEKLEISIENIVKRPLRRIRHYQVVLKDRIASKLQRG